MKPVSRLLGTAHTERSMGPQRIDASTASTKHGPTETRSMQTTTYEANRFTFTKVFTFPADLVRNWFVISSLIKRELKGRYLNSALGAVWTVLTPLFMLAVYTLVFAKILQAKWEYVGLPEHLAGSDFVFAMMLYTAMTPFLAFQESLTRGSGIILENSNLIKKVAFPSEALPVFVVGYTFVNELIGIFLLVCALPMLGFPITAFFLWYPVLAFLRLLFTLGMVFIVSTVNVFIRDVGQMIGLVTMLWMFLTPIFYAEEMLERSEITWLIPAMHLNPWYYIVNMYRDIFLRAKAPDPVLLGTMFGIALATFVVGYAMFMTAKVKFSDEI